MSLQRRQRGAGNEKGYKMYAVIKTGGKQYRVAPNDKIQIEKLIGGPGDRIEFGEVLLIAGENGVDVGTPLVSGARVVGEIASQDRGPKIVIFKKKRRKHYRRKNGHRQDLTSVIITDIMTAGAEPAPKQVVEPAFHTQPEE